MELAPTGYQRHHQSQMDKIMKKETKRNRKHPHLKKIKRRYTAKQQAQFNCCPQRSYIIVCPARLYPTRVKSEAHQGYRPLPIIVSHIWVVFPYSTQIDVAHPSLVLGQTVPPAGWQVRLIRAQSQNMYQIESEKLWLQNIGRWSVGVCCFPK